MCGFASIFSDLNNLIESIQDIRSRIDLFNSINSDTNYRFYRFPANIPPACLFVVHSKTGVPSLQLLYERRATILHQAFHFHI